MEWIPTWPKVSWGMLASCTVPIDQTEPCDWIRGVASSHGLPGPVPQQNYSHSLQGKAQRRRGVRNKKYTREQSAGVLEGTKEKGIVFSGWHANLYDISIALNGFVYTEVEIYHGGCYNVQLYWFKRPLEHSTSIQSMSQLCWMYFLTILIG